jgi:hypothetical protein
MEVKEGSVNSRRSGENKKEVTCACEVEVYETEKEIHNRTGG